ncbi:nitrilase-related carbon-nitrogen hydrolase [Tropicimonas sp.]|uniref:nitrilase-related carbon-nitrogen hydrolase n=1 Tax=Tropicimonas sp. TaxID=2067044 RepID=UPI003A8844CD
MTKARTIRLACAAYPVDRLPDWAALEEKLDRWIGGAAADGAALLVLPEYAGLEAALVDAPPNLPLAEWWPRSAAVAERYAALCGGLARRHSVFLLGGSLPANGVPGLVNRAHLHTPTGETGYQDKQILTPWERDFTPLVPGEPLTPFETDLGRIGVLICYDAEFPALATVLKPDVLLVPSNTETMSGQQRVRIAARARALEQQCVAIHAPMVGPVPGCPIVDENYGRAAIFAPPDVGFPATGILAQGVLNRPGWCHAEVSRAALRQCRTEGQVSTRTDSARADSCAAGATLRGFAENRP